MALKLPNRCPTCDSEETLQFQLGNKTVDAWQELYLGPAHGPDSGTVIKKVACANCGTSYSRMERPSGLPTVVAGALRFPAKPAPAPAPAPAAAPEKVAESDSPLTRLTRKARSRKSEKEGQA